MAHLVVEAHLVCCRSAVAAADDGGSICVGHSLSDCLGALGEDRVLEYAHRSVPDNSLGGLDSVGEKLDALSISVYDGGDGVGARREIVEALMDDVTVSRALKRISHEILEKNNGAENICIIGIQRRGIPLAQIIADNIEKIEEKKVPVGSIDITFYRDDLTNRSRDPMIRNVSLCGR